MPKTKDAFALRGFDENSFLCKEMSKLGLGADALQKPDADREDFADLQRARLAYLNLCDELKNFRRRLIRHNARLGKYHECLTKTIAVASDEDYFSIIKPRSKRAVLLSDQHATIAKKLIEAEEAAATMIEVIDGYQRICCLKIFSRRLKEARKSAGMTQTELGKLLGVSQRTVAYYEQGHREPSLPTLKILSELSASPVDWFLNI